MTIWRRFLSSLFRIMTADFSWFISVREKKVVTFPYFLDFCFFFFFLRAFYINLNVSRLTWYIIIVRPRVKEKAKVKKIKRTSGRDQRKAAINKGNFRLRLRIHLVGIDLKRPFYSTIVIWEGMACLYFKTAFQNLNWSWFIKLKCQLIPKG